MNKVINAYCLRSDRYTMTKSLTQYDYGQILKIHNVQLPETYEVHFSNSEAAGITKTVIGNADGVSIPDEYLRTGKPVFAYIFLHKDNDDGKTVYKIKIPVDPRPAPTDEPITQQEQSAISQAIAAVNEVLEHQPKIVDGNIMIYDAETEQWVYARSIDRIVLNGDYTLTIYYADGTSTRTASIRGATGPQGPKGDTGATGATGPQGEPGPSEIPVDTNAVTSTTDGALYSALSKLGWKDTIVSGMIGIKNLLTKILENLQILNGRRTNYGRVTSANITLAPNTSTWTTLAFPSALNGKDVRFAGYYVSDMHANVTSCQMASDGMHMAIGNLGSSSITFSVTCVFSY